MHPYFQDPEIDILEMKKKDQILSTSAKVPIDPSEATEDLYFHDSEKDYSDDSSSEYDEFDDAYFGL